MFNSLVEDGPKVRGLSCVLSGACTTHYDSLFRTSSAVFELCLTLFSQMRQARSVGVVFVFFELTTSIIPDRQLLLVLQ
jgi:hypothetical protein